jgi:hypothetical protein
MSGDLISKKTRYEFREFLVGWTLRQIEMEFDSADIQCDMGYTPFESGARRSLVEQYYHSLDFTAPADVRKLIKAYESILNTAVDRASTAGLGEDHYRDTLKRVEQLANWLRKDGYICSNGTVTPRAGAPVLADLRAIATKFDAAQMHDQISRLERAVDSDPALAIGTAKELVETCCKTIMSERGKTPPANLDLPKLVKAALDELNLLPEGVPEQAKGAKTIRVLLSNLATISQGLAEIRGLYGTGHGKEGKSRGLGPRHARLAVGAAATLALFLFETHKERSGAN